MKLVRFGNPGAEKPGLVDQQGGLRDLSGVVADITPENLSRSMLEKLAAISPSKLPLVDGAPRLGVPIAAVGKFVAIGLNYADHAAEANLPLPSEPIVFQKAITSLSGPNDPVVLPQDSTKSDWEVELGIVIGTRASYVERADALAHVAGYCVVNDVSEREYQMERGGTWDKGKGCPAAVAGKPVDIYDFPDGRLEIRWKGLPLPYSVFDHLQRVSHAAIIENKRLGEVLAWINRRERFRSNATQTLVVSAVAACSRYQSGEVDWSGEISRCGDEMIRTMLYEAAQSMMHSKKWCWLKAWAMQIARRRGMKKAIVALARRLAVIMHRIWVDGTEFRWTREQAAAAA